MKCRYCWIRYNWEYCHLLLFYLINSQLSFQSTLIRFYSSKHMAHLAAFSVNCDEHFHEPRQRIISSQLNNCFQWQRQWASDARNSDIDHQWSDLILHERSLLHGVEKLQRYSCNCILAWKSFLWNCKKTVTSQRNHHIALEQNAIWLNSWANGPEPPAIIKKNPSASRVLIK